MPVENKRVSVIIPTFNRLRQTLQAVSSVIEQSYSDFELIVVDDGSTETQDALREFLSRAGQTYLRQENRGVAAARNLGVKHSRGYWISFLDSDDVWHEEKLSQQVRFHLENPSFRISQTEEKWIRKGRPVNPRKTHRKPNGEAFGRSLELCVISPSSVMMERSLFEEVGGFDESMRVCEDYDLWLRITKNYLVGYLEEKLVTKFGGHQDQLSASEPAMDRFRLYSLLGLRDRGELSIEQNLKVEKAIREKSKVLLLGARKRGNRHLESLIHTILETNSQCSRLLDPIVD